MASQHERIYVWEIPVRLTHWTNVVAILTLSATGFYIGNPVVAGSASLMAWARGIHRIAAYAFIASLALRTYWSMVGNQWASWRALFPLITGEGRRGLPGTLSYYFFQRSRPPLAVGHNALAGMTYSGVIVLYVLQVLTGFALQSIGTFGWRAIVFGWVFWVLDAQAVRLLHHMIMWFLLGFAVHHVYSAFLVDIEEKNGLITSMVSGYKFIGRRT